MKNSLLAVLSAIATFTFIYLIGAFGSASFDISKWSDVGRVFTSALGGFLSIIAFVVTFFYMEDQYKR